MKYWNEYLTREDLESEPGVIDCEKIRILSLNLYLKYIEGCVELGAYDFYDAASEMMEDVMTEEFMCYTRVMEGRRPGPGEIAEHLRKPENIEIRRFWTSVCMHAEKENWPEFVKLLRKELNIPEDIFVKNEEQIRQQMKKTAMERNWIIKEL